MGPVFFFQPWRSHPGAHSVMVFTQRRLSVKTLTAASSGSRVNASMRARSSMRLFVVSGSWPCFSDTISPFSTHTTPQPPGPGFGDALPSVEDAGGGPSVRVLRAGLGPASGSPRAEGGRGWRRRAPDVARSSSFAQKPPSSASGRGSTSAASRDSDPAPPGQRRTAFRTPGTGSSARCKRIRQPTRGARSLRRRTVQTPGRVGWGGERSRRRRSPGLERHRHVHRDGARRPQPRRVLHDRREVRGVEEVCSRPATPPPT